MFVGGGAFYNSPEIKVMHGRIPGEYSQTIADLLHRVKLSLAWFLHIPVPQIPSLRVDETEQSLLLN